MSSSFFRGNKYCYCAGGALPGSSQHRSGPECCIRKFLLWMLDKANGSKNGGCNPSNDMWHVYIYIYTYYADVQLYTIFNLPSKFFLFQSLSLWEVKHVNAERKISTAWNSVFENDCSRPEVCKLEGNHHYHPDQFGACHPGSKIELPAEDMEKNKRFLDHYTQKVDDMSKALISWNVSRSTYCTLLLRDSNFNLFCNHFVHRRIGVQNQRLLARW